MIFGGFFERVCACVCVCVFFFFFVVFVVVVVGGGFDDFFLMDFCGWHGGGYCGCGGGC